MSVDDFDYVTSYETERFCKPDPAYYLDICNKLGPNPEHCLMIGNDDREDMHAASQAGLKSYLVTDCRIPDEENPWDGEMGTFTEMLAMLQRND